MIALFVGLCCFLLHAATTLVWLRLPARMSPVARHAISAIGTHVFGVALAAFAVGPFAYWPAAAVSAFGAVCWLFAFSAVYKSVSLRILTELDHAPHGVIPLDAITEEHVRPEFAARIAVLMKMGCVEETEDGFVITEQGTEMARRIGFVRRICGVAGSGMYGDSANAECEQRRGSNAHPVAYTPGSPVITPPTP